MFAPKTPSNYLHSASEPSRPPQRALQRPLEIPLGPQKAQGLPQKPKATPNCTTCPICVECVGAFPLARNMWENLSKDTRKTTDRGHSGNHQQGHAENHKQGTLGEPPADTLGQLQGTNRNRRMRKKHEITYFHVSSSSARAGFREATGICIRTVQCGTMLGDVRVPS